MRMLFKLPFLSLACGLLAQAADPSLQPLVDLRIADGGMLVQHWNAAPIGKTWAEPGVAPLRERVNRELPMLAGFDPLAALADSSEARLVVSAINGTPEDPHVHFQAQIRLATTAPSIFAVLAKHGIADNVANADEAVLLGEANSLRLVRRGEWLLLAPAIDPAPLPLLAASSASVASSADSHDLLLRIDGPQLADWILTNHPLPTTGPSAAQVRALLPLITGQIDFTAKGGASTFEVHTAAAWLAPINPTAWQRLPGQLLDVTAIGLDGKALWQEAEPLITQLLAANSTSDHQDPLQAAGITSSWKDLVTSLHGTWVLAISPSMPMPGYHLIGPRTPALDELMGLLAHRFAEEIPAQGAAVTLIPEGLPITITLARTTDQWLISSDPNFAANWVITGSDGGWATSPLGTIAAAKLAGDGCLLMIGDTQAQIRSLAPLINVGFAAMPGVLVTPAEKQAAMKFINRLAANVTSGWSVAHHRGALVEITGEGVLSTGGSVPVLAVLAGMLLPAITLVRETARKKNSGNNIRQLVLGSIVWSNDNDLEWPLNLEIMIAYLAADFSPKILRSPGDPTRINAYLYIRPVSNASAMQPCIVEDPACWKGKGCTVGFCDGHIAWIPKERAKRVWAEAQRLAALPHATLKEKGIAPEEWSAVQEDLTPTTIK